MTYDGDTTYTYYGPGETGEYAALDADTYKDLIAELGALIPSTETGYVFLYLFSTVTEEVALESAGCVCDHDKDTYDGKCSNGCCEYDEDTGWDCGYDSTDPTSCTCDCGYGEDIVYTDPETGKMYVIAGSNDKYETFTGFGIEHDHSKCWLVGDDGNIVEMTVEINGHTYTYYFCTYCTDNDTDGETAGGWVLVYKDGIAVEERNSVCPSPEIFAESLEYKGFHVIIN